ncbi:MAG: hypothetical protein U0872_15325 [Planctomycetaceae bacterium]
MQAADKAVRDAERCIQKITEGANQGTPWVGGSFGRALLAYGCKLRDDELTSLRAELAAMTAERDDLRAAIKEIDSVGMWLSAALDDENSCKEFKADIERYMQAMDRTGLFNDPIPTAPSKETGE